MLELIIVVFVVFAAAIGVGWRLWRCCTRRSACPGCGTCPLARENPSNAEQEPVACGSCRFISSDRVSVRGQPWKSPKMKSEKIDRSGGDREVALVSDG